jgi:hypothetical protein
MNPFEELAQDIRKADLVTLWEDEFGALYLRTYSRVPVHIAWTMFAPVPNREML